MKLRKPPYPDPIGTAAYYWVHAGHRQTGIDTAIEVIRQAAEKEIATGPDDVLANELTGMMRGWAIESLIQGLCCTDQPVGEVSPPPASTFM